MRSTTYSKTKKILNKKILHGNRLCQSFDRELSEAIRMLYDQGSSTTFAQVNVAKNRRLVEYFEIAYVPTVFFFKEGSVTECTENTAAGLVKWIKKHEILSLTKLRSVTEAEEFIAKESIVVLGFFLNIRGNGAAMLSRVANSFQKCAFGLACERSLLRKYSVSDGTIILLKKSAAPIYFEGNFIATELLHFLRRETSDTLIEANQNTLSYIFSTPIMYKLFFFVFEPLREVVDVAARVSNLYKQSVIFATVDVRNPSASQLLDFMGIDKNCMGEIPTMRILTHCQRYKYKPDDNTITIASIKYFVESVIQGKRKNYLRSAKPSADWNKGPVWKLTSTLFQQVVFDLNISVLVKFFAPWCGPCHACAPAYEQAARRYQNRSDVCFCEIDMTVNELSEVNIQGFPTIILFAKNNTRHNYVGDRSAKSFCDFIDQHTK